METPSASLRMLCATCVMTASVCRETVAYNAEMYSRESIIDTSRPGRKMSIMKARLNLRRIETTREVYHGNEALRGVDK